MTHARRSPPLTRNRLARRRLLLAGMGSACLVARAGAGAGDPAAGEKFLAEQRAALCSADNASGVGLRGEYFGAEGLRGEALLVRVDGPVDFDATLDWPAERAGRRPRSVRWSGWVKPSVAGHYRFHAADLPQARVLVARRPMAGAGAPADARIELAAGRFYPISFEIDHLRSLGNMVRLEWTAPFGSRFVIPRSLLYVPTDTVAKPAG
jgi:hypothetical protein